MNRAVIPILAIDDDDVDAHLIKEKLSRAEEGVYDLTHVPSLTAGVNCLRDGQFAAVLLDLMLTESTGLATFEQLHEQYPEVPIVVLTGQKDQSLALEAVRLGAQDYLVKDKLDASMLARSIRYAIERKRAQLETLRALQEVALLERKVLDIGNQERMRISHDLHDSVGQTLAGTNYLAQSLITRLKSSSPENVEIAEKIVEGIQASLSSVHNAVRGLVPVDNHKNGFHFAVQQLLHDTQETFPIRCSLECDSPVPIHDNQVATELYLIVREAVHNAVKHSNATKIVVSLKRAGECFRVEVADDGEGMSQTTQLTSTRMGLRIMRYRANSIEADLTIESEAGRGTTVLLTCPSAHLHHNHSCEILDGDD